MGTNRQTVGKGLVGDRRGNPGVSKTGVVGTGRVREQARQNNPGTGRVRKQVRQAGQGQAGLKPGEQSGR